MGKPANEDPPSTPSEGPAGLPATGEPAVSGSSPGGGAVGGGVSGALAGEGGGALRVYVRTRPVARLGLVGRGVAAGVAGGCLAVLMVAASINPDPRGVGTHEQLGLPACGMIELFNLPCPSCGFTTSFALFAHGRWLASLLNQPAGFLLALAAAMTVWVAGFVAVSGKPVHRLLAPLATPRRVFAMGFLLLVAWAWKIVLVRWGVGG